VGQAAVSPTSGPATRPLKLRPTVFDTLHQQVHNQLCCARIADLAKFELTSRKKRTEGMCIEQFARAEDLRAGKNGEV
jgi:hypothetical protein